MMGKPNATDPIATEKSMCEDKIAQSLELVQQMRPAMYQAPRSLPTEPPLGGCVRDHLFAPLNVLSTLLHSAVFLEWLTYMDISDLVCLWLLIGLGELTIRRSEGRRKFKSRDLFSCFPHFKVTLDYFSPSTRSPLLSMQSTVIKLSLSGSGNQFLSLSLRV